MTFSVNSFDFSSILTADRLESEARSTLETRERTDEARSHALGIAPEAVPEAIAARWDLWQTIKESPKCDRLDAILGGTLPSQLDTLWTLWLPLAMQLADLRTRGDRPLIQGILGGQGTGKTTLTQILTEILAAINCRTASLSIDDIYKTYADRAALQTVDPRLVWRGPPGTHDIDLGIAVLDRLRNGEPADLPRFDKSLHQGQGDRATPEPVANIDVILFEGWFVGARPVSPEVFDTAPDPIVTDADKAFARDCNDRLHSYLPLWDRLDRLMVLYPEDYRLSKEWRKQAERQMKAKGKSGMSDAQIDEFVNYFWKSLHPDLFVRPLVEKGRTPCQETVDLVVLVQRDRSVARIYRP